MTEDRRQGFWIQFHNRNTRLILTLVSKQWLVFFIATALLTHKFITAEIWVFLAAFVTGANVYQKQMGVTDVKPKQP